MDKISRTADLFAIPCFLIASMYFIKKENKDWLEVFLTVFVICGLTLDLLFSLDYIGNLTSDDISDTLMLISDTTG